jgi:glycosyltransferase involved in cell wall biosynthesis
MALAGAQHILLAQSKWFREQGYHVVVAFFYDKEGIQSRWEREHDLDIVNLQAWQAGGPLISNLPRLARGLYRLHRLISRERPDVIETFTHHCNLLGLPIAWMKGVPRRIGTHHGRPEMGPGMDALHSFLAKVGVMTDVVAVSEHLREKAERSEGIPPDKITVITNGIADRSADPNPRSAAAQIRSELKVRETGHLVLAVGRQVPEKRHIDLIEAVPKVVERFPETVFAFAGDGPLHEDLKRRVEELGLESNVRLLGVRSDVPSLLAAADLFAHPSQREGCPLAVLEAMSMGVPIVARAFDGITDVLKHRETALLVPAEAPSELAAAVVEALDSPQLRQDLARAGKQIIAREFSVQSMCERYDILFRTGSLAP